MSTLSHEVHACGGCPLFASDDRNGEWCAHPLADGVEVNSVADDPPRKCPLRKQLLLVHLKGKP